MLKSSSIADIICDNVVNGKLVIHVNANFIAVIK